MSPALSALALLIAAAPSTAVVVRGQVVARGSRRPAAGAGLTIDGVTAGETDEAGGFSLALPPGHHVLQVQFPGYDPVARQVEAFAGAGPLLVALEPGLAGPRFETVIQPPSLEAPRLTLEQEETTATPGALGDPFRVIESLPGVSPAFWPLPVYAIRGANPGNTGFFIDDLRTPTLFHFALGPAVIHPYFIDSLDFYAGAYPARYGGQVAGLVVASTVAPPADRLRASVDVRLYDAGGMVSEPIDGGRGTVTVAGRYGYPGALVTALASDVKLSYWDYQARLDHRLGPGRLTLFAFGSSDLLEQASGRTALVFHRLEARWQGALAGGSATAAVALGLDDTEAALLDHDLTVRSKSFIPRLAYAHPLGRAADLELGADGELRAFETSLRGDPPGLAPFARPRRAATGGAHLSLVLGVGDRLVISPGLRLDGFSDGEARALDLGPRIFLRVRAARGLRLVASGGKFSQMPSMPLALPGAEDFGLRQLGLQTSWQGAAGLEADLPRGLSLAASAFVHRYRLTDIRDPELGDPFLDDFLTSRQALARGLELMVRRPPTARLHGWLSYTLARADRSFEGGVVAPSDWDQRHTLNAVVGYRWRRTTVGIRYHVNTGRLVKLDGAAPPDYARLPPFQEVDLRLDRRVVMDRYTLVVYVELVNASLTRQVVGLRRTPEGITREGFRIVVPSLGVRAEL